MKETIVVNVGNKSMTAAVLNFYFPPCAVCCMDVNSDYCAEFKCAGRNRPDGRQIYFPAELNKEF
jgi:hypothetical protein